MLKVKAFQVQLNAQRKFYKIIANVVRRVDVALLRFGYLWTACG
jgi:hypothetical protein